ncbi:SRPBCC domain-containing protein [Paenibacillus spongiae]|uniref:SRPBCC domain-containing protein n=1 Tax=Paenibacillus spongiae TaxID=2909671 RepID=A0ABY5S674_9BACL|nr:SRPBCC domain-containing protein [Paenibacillus spongiae]UVI29407.1 SRPBCC domain-containing protein [Paenibacillus spongiae]
MPGRLFKQAVEEATGTAWEQWVVKLQQKVDPRWSHEQVKHDICETYDVTDEWAEWLAVMYGQLLGRIPVGVTKEAGTQIGVRKTITMTKEQAWTFLTSPQGLSLWVGNVSEFQAEKGFEYESAEGVSGKITVVEPFHKLRMTWKRPDWDKPSRLQFYLLSTKGGKTTIAVHQEMLEDVYMREQMRRFWEERLLQIQSQWEAE